MANLSNPKQIAVIAKEIWRVAFITTSLVYLVLGDYQLKKARALPVYLFGGLLAFGFLMTLIDRIKVIKSALETNKSIPDAIYERDLEGGEKARMIHQPKPIEGKFRYVVWTLPAMFMIPFLLLAVTFPLAVAPHSKNSWIALIIMEIFFLGVCAGIGVVIYLRKREAKRLNISLTDSMVRMFEDWEIRRQQRLNRPSPLRTKQKYILNSIGFFACVVLLALRAIDHVHYRFFGIYHREMSLALLWVYTFVCPLNILSVYIESDGNRSSK